MPLSTSQPRIPGLTLKGWFVMSGVAGAIISQSGGFGITRTVAGTYNLTFNAMSSANYVVDAVFDGSPFKKNCSSRTTTSCTMVTVDQAGSAADAQTAWIGFYE